MNESIKFTRIFIKKKKKKFHQSNKLKVDELILWYSYY